MGIEIVRQGPERITKAKIDAAWRARAPSRRLIILDAETRGLSLIVNATSMSWTYSYKPRGIDQLSGRRFATKSITIGNPETHSPDEAREEAGRLKGQAKAGADPQAEKKARMAEAARRRSQTIGRLIDSYAKALPKRPKLRGGSGTLSARAAAAELGHVRAAIAAMKATDRAVDEVSSSDLRRMLASVADKPATARHRYGALSRFFDWAQDEGLVTANPCLQLAKARRPRPVQPRRTHHTTEQLATLWRAVSAAEGPSDAMRDLLTFLIIVPCRRGEAAAMRWENVDLDAAVWSQPGAMTKNGDPHRFHLPALALNLLRKRHGDANSPKQGLVFPSPRAGKAIDTFAKAKKAVDAKLPEGFTWRLHDHRRSFVTALAEAGAHETVLDAILNHRQSITRAGVLGVYQQAKRWPEQMDAMEQWNALLVRALAPAEGTGHEQ